MKLQHLTPSVLVLLGFASLACSSGRDEIVMGGDGGSSPDGDSAGSKNASGGAAGAGNGTAGASGNTAGSSSGGASSGGRAGVGGAASAGTGNSAAGAGGGSDYEPCAGKSCGDSCNPCAPNDANCASPAVQMTCTVTGQCSSERPSCTPPTCQGNQKYFTPGCPGDNSQLFAPFTAGCYDTCSTSASCSDGFECTPAWHDPSAGCAGANCEPSCGAEVYICTKAN